MARWHLEVDPNRPESLTAQVAQTLREMIRSGVLAVGASLPSRAALSRSFKVSECVVRAALRDLAADRLVAGKPRRGHVVLAVPREDRPRLVLDVSTENLGSFSSRISTVECARAIFKSGNRVLPVVLGADARETPYLSPLQEALRQRPDLVVVRVSSSRRAVVTGLLASCGCPYATLALGNRARSPGRSRATSATMWTTRFRTWLQRACGRAFARPCRLTSVWTPTSARIRPLRTSVFSSSACPCRCP